MTVTCFKGDVSGTRWQPDSLFHTPPPPRHPGRLPVLCRIHALCHFPTPPPFASPRLPALPFILASPSSSHPPCPATSPRPTIFHLPAPSPRLARYRFQLPGMLVLRPTPEPLPPPYPRSPHHTASPDSASCRTSSHPTSLPANRHLVSAPLLSTHPPPRPPLRPPPPFPHLTTPHTGHRSPPPPPPPPPSPHAHTLPHLPHAPAASPARPAYTHLLLASNQLSRDMSTK
jgi:hypothetical protein